MTFLLYMINDIYNNMAKKTKFNIFNVMAKDDLIEALKTNLNSPRYYQRLVAMRLVEYGHSIKETAEILDIGERTVQRWVKNCSKKGLNGLKPNFNGGRKSKLSDDDKEKFKEILDNNDLTITDAKNILRDEFNLDYSLSYVGRLIKKLGYNYGSPRVKFKEEPENAEEILKKTLKKQM